MTPDKLLNKITPTTEKVWNETYPKIKEKYGDYHYGLVVNGLGEVEVYDYKTFTVLAKGNRAAQKKLKELAGK